MSMNKNNIVFAKLFNGYSPPGMKAPF